MSSPVVFDCDGVLVDSEGLGWAALEKVLRRYGPVTITPEDRAVLAGATYEDDYTHFSAQVALPPAPALWVELSKVMFELFDAKLQAFEDAIDALDALSARGVPLAVASNSPRDRLDKSLIATGLSGYFHASVSGDEVSAPKPAPDIYLRSAELLGVDPTTCLAVEDTPSGIEAAKAAGMTVIAVERGEHSREELSRADAIVPRLTPITLLRQSFPDAASDPEAS